MRVKNLDRHITLRTSASDRQILKRVSSALGLSVSDYVRQKAREDHEKFFGKMKKEEKHERQTT